MREMIRRAPLVWFFVLSYALSWAYWVPLLLRGVHVVPGSSATHFPGLAGPALAACIIAGACDGAAGVRQLLGRLVLVTRPRSLFWAYSLSPLAFLAAAIAVMRLRGASLPGVQDFARFSGLPELGLPLVFLLVFVVGSWGEELGWRGFALERLQRHFGPLGGALVLAALWAGWHLPAFGIIQSYRAMTPAMIAGGFLLGLAAGSIVLARVTSRTYGSVLAAGLWHATYNMTAATSAGGGFIAAFTTTCVMVWAVALVIGELRRPASGSLLQVVSSTASTVQPAAVA